MKSLISLLTFDGGHHLRIASSSPLPNWSCVYNWKDFRETVNSTLGLNLLASSLTLPSRIFHLHFPLKFVTCSRTSCSSPALSSIHLGVSWKTPSYSAYKSANLCHHMHGCRYAHGIWIPISTGDQKFSAENVFSDIAFLELSACFSSAGRHLPAMLILGCAVLCCSTLC